MYYMKIKQNLNAGAVELQPDTLNSDYALGTTRNVCYDVFFRFVFNYVYLEDKHYWEVDIVSLPSYQGRDDSSYLIHTTPSARGGNKLWVMEGTEPRTELEAKKLSTAWAEKQIVYILTGILPQVQDEEFPRLRRIDIIV